MVLMGLTTPADGFVCRGARLKEFGLGPGSRFCGQDNSVDWHCDQVYLTPTPQYFRILGNSGLSDGKWSGIKGAIFAFNPLGASR